MNKSIKSGPLYRSVELTRDGINVEKRTVNIAFASEMPADRWFGKEILDCTSKSCDLSTMNRGGNLIMDHNPSDVVGVCERAVVEGDKVCRGTFRFGSSARAQEIWKDVTDGIRNFVSVGYRVQKMVTESVDNGVETLRAVSWKPFEVSITSTPLDPSVGIGRSAASDMNDVEIELMRNLDPAPNGQGTAGNGTPPPQAIVVRSNDDIRKEILKDHAEIRAIAKQANVVELGEKAIADGTDPLTFRQQAFEHVCKGAKPIPASGMNTEIGMGNSDIKDYRICRGILALGSRSSLEGLEKEASDAVAKKLGKQPGGFFVPMDVQKRSFSESMGLNTRQQANVMDEYRALVPNVFTQGGAFISTDLLTGSLIDLLRNSMQVMALGARNLTGLQGDVAIPRITGGATAYWLAVGAAVTRSQQATGQLALTPHRLAAATAYDKQLLIQSSLSVEAFVREDLMTILAIEKDRACINGSGVSGEPLGILNTTGLSTPVTFATAASPLFSEIIKFETNLATNNADRGNLAFLVHPSVRGFAKGFPKFTSTGFPIWENDSMNGYPARASNQVPSATSVIFGRFDDLVVADWDGLDVVNDPYSLSLNAQIGIVMQMYTDIGIRHATSFAVSTN